MAKVSSTVRGLGRSAPRVHVSPTPSRSVGVGCGCHGGSLKSYKAGPRASGLPSWVAKLALMRRILLGAVAAVVLLAVGTRAADALGVGGVRLGCGCVETCWCKRPGLTLFRWVTPSRWHHIGLTAEEKQSRHLQT